MLRCPARFALAGGVTLCVSAGTLAAQRCASVQVQVTGIASATPVLRVRLTDSTGVVVSMAPLTVDGRAVLSVASTHAEVVAEVFGQGISRRRRISLMRTTNVDCSVTIPLDAFTGTLEGVRVIGRREAPAERFVGSLAVGASEQLSDGSAAALLPTDGDVAARARTQLLTLVQDGAVSLGGLATRESQQRLNGMVNGAGVLPRSLPLRQRIGTGAYDITAGGFSGASVELEIARAGEFRELRADVITGVAPTPRGEATPTASTVAVDAGGEWRSVDQRHGASVGIRTALTQSPFTSVQTASPGLRGAAGFGQENVDTVLALLAREDPQLLALPGRRAPVRWTTAVAARLDPFIAPSASPAASRQNALIVAAEHSVAAPELQDISATASLATAAERTTGSAMWQHQQTRAATRFDARLGIRGARQTITSAGAAFATLDVPVTAPDADARTTVGQPLRFGGLPGRTSTERGIEARGVATRQLRSTRITGLVALRAVGRELWPGVSLSTWIRVRSGLPFTPIIDRDINADGVARNDRAFIPDWTAPGASADVTRWAALLPARAVDCLASQRGRIAARGSCTGPWSAQSNLTVTLDGRRIGLTERTQLTASLENLGGGLEQLLALAPGRAVGGAAGVDAVLARVRPDGDVDLNPRIGRTVPPVPGLGGNWRVVLSVNQALSAPVQRQQLTRWLDMNGVGRRLATDSLARRLSRNVINLYDTLEEADAELAYDDLQRQIIASRRRLYDRTRDSIWTDVATRLNRLPSRVSVDSAMPLLQAATDTAWHLSWVHARAFAASLTPIQRQLLPWPASALATAARRPRFNIVYY